MVQLNHYRKEVSNASTWNLSSVRDSRIADVEQRRPMNFESFDRAIQRTTARSIDNLSTNIDNQLSEVQRRHQERLALLQKQYLDEQQQIKELLGE